MSGEPLPVEHVDCPLCGGSEQQELFVARDRLLGKPGAFPVVRCAGCGLVFLNPRPAPETLKGYYPDSYYPLGTEPSREAVAVARGLLGRVTGWVDSAGIAKPTVLDVGCGTGLFLREARERGWQVSGIELSESAVDYARGRFGLPVTQGSLETVELPGAGFDAITLWHVLEHLPDPVTALGQLRRALKPGGLLLLGVPNFASLEARCFGRRWYSLDAPRHLTHFTPETLQRALELAGLEPVRIVQSDGTAGLVYSLMGDLTGICLKLCGRPLPERAYHALAGVLGVPAGPLCRLAARLGRGGALEVYAIRRA